MKSLSASFHAAAVAITAALAVATLAGCGGANAQSPVFTLSSADIAPGASIGSKHVLNGFGCSGQNISPALSWSGAPAGTRSYSITVYDPDAPTGSGFWHWGVHNLPASTTELPQGAANAASRLPVPAYTASNDFHDTGVTGGNGNWGGPCPPAGDAPHRYVFTVYALDVADVSAAAGIPRTATAALHGFALNFGLKNHVLAKASFTATYGH